MTWRYGRLQQLVRCQGRGCLGGRRCPTCRSSRCRRRAGLGFGCWRRLLRRRAAQRADCGNLLGRWDRPLGWDRAWTETCRYHREGRGWRPYSFEVDRHAHRLGCSQPLLHLVGRRLVAPQLPHRAIDFRNGLFTGEPQTTGHQGAHRRVPGGALQGNDRPRTDIWWWQRLTSLQAGALERVSGLGPGSLDPLTCSAHCLRISERAAHCSPRSGTPQGSSVCPLGHRPHLSIDAFVTTGRLCLLSWALL